jgi:hypothetical protein
MNRIKTRPEASIGLLGRSRAGNGEVQIVTGQGRGEDEGEMSGFTVRLTRRVEPETRASNSPARDCQSTWRYPWDSDNEFF